MAFEKVTEEEGIFDPKIVVDLDTGEAKIPIAEIFYEYEEGFYEDESTRAKIGLEGKISTGAEYGLALSLDRNKSTSQVQTLSPRYTSKLSFNLTHPLLRDFGADRHAQRFGHARFRRRVPRQRACIL